ncbi:hypothetical protein DY000_02025852 [Brassica cretica]|uniref:Tyrosine specific protein phosphatases domain-containing protein n=1 Tax=Brassica cretica TaxID=69181 RepID=A0ABQ7E9Y8_BRACR|nr:hypothetical protein DY000_02025852 [Brassica cretica]
MITAMPPEESGRSSYLPRKRHLENPSEEQSKRSRLYQNANVIPHGWLDCPPFGHEIGPIIPSKVPLSESYNDHLPPDKRYTFRQLLTNNKRNKLGLVIDLTNTTRYYNPSTELLRREGIEYVKIRCSGRDSVPDNVSVNTFVHEVNQFERRNFSKKSVLVHCTHGHNRTGFMVVHYLMRSSTLMSVTQALKTFYDARSSAKFGSGPEALGGFYVGVVVDKEMVLLLGDMKKEAFKKTNASPSSSLGAVFIAKKEHVFGKRAFATKAELCADGKIHDVVIECDTSVTDPCLVVRVDGKTLLQVKRLKWKFRGNDTIVVNRMAVEVLWDVHSWLFGMPSAGNAVFMFRTCQSSSEKSLSFSQDVMATTTNSKSQSFGFSLILYAWKNE